MMRFKTRAGQWLAAVAVVVGVSACDDIALPPAPPPAAFVFPNSEWVGDDGMLRQAERGIATNAFGSPVDWAQLLAVVDGFSPVQPLLIPTVEGCPPLPQPRQEADSVADSSPVLVVDLATGTRVPWFGEPGEDPAICELFPLAPFSEGGEVLVAVTDRFAAQLPGEIAGLDPEHGPAAVDVGLAPASIKASFRFRVGTIRNRIEPVYAMRDDAVAWLDAQTSPLVIETHPFGDPIADTLFAWGGTYRVPWFLGADGRVVFDAAGRPVVQGEFTETFVLIANPELTTTTNAPLVQFGHGLFGDPSELLGGGTRVLRQLSGGVWGAVAWGMAARYFHRAGAGIVQPGNIALLRDIVWQSLVNQIVFTRALRTELAPQVAAQFGVVLSDVVDYLGISQGGILGSPLMALSPELRRGVLHVGGGGWSAMMTHSSNWDGRDTPDAPVTGLGFGTVLAEMVPNDRERTLVQALWQVLWDAWDPALFAPYWLASPSWATDMIPAGRGIVYNYAVADPQVPNFSSDLVLRMSNTPLVEPSIYDPFAVARVTFADGPFQAVAQQWDVGPGQVAHSEPRKLVPWATNAVAFLTQQVFLDTCNGKPCRFDPETQAPLE